MRATSLILLVLATSGCSGAVEVATPDTVDATSAEICADLEAALPEKVSAQDSRETDPESALTAAWGDPAIVIRCGVPPPAALQPTSQLTSVNGVDWFAEDLTGGYLFTTYGRLPYVEVTVPDEYSPQVGPVAELSAAVAETVPLEGAPAPAPSADLTTSP